MGQTFGSYTLCLKYILNTYLTIEKLNALNELSIKMNVCDIDHVRFNDFIEKIW